MEILTSCLGLFLFGTLLQERHCSVHVQSLQELWSGERGSLGGGGVRGLHKDEDRPLRASGLSSWLQSAAFTKLRKSGKLDIVMVGWDEASFHDSIFHFIHIEHEWLLL